MAPKIHILQNSHEHSVPGLFQLFKRIFTCCTIIRSNIIYSKKNRRTLWYSLICPVRIVETGREESPLQENRVNMTENSKKTSKPNLPKMVKLETEERNFDVRFEKIKTETELSVPVPPIEDDLVMKYDPDSIESILPNDVEKESDTKVFKNLANARKGLEFKEKFAVVKIYQLEWDLEGEIKSFECEECHRHFPEEELLKNHCASVHSEIVFKHECLFCIEKFSFEWFLKNHMKTMHSGITISFSCPLCRKSFYSKNSLEEHKRNIHNLREHPFNCNHCEDSFECITLLRKHLVQSHPGTTEAISAGCNIKFKEQTVMEAKDSDLICRVCDISFLSKDLKKAHVDRVHGGNYICTCGKSFPSKVRLGLHESTHQETAKQFKCEICGNTFPWFRSLALHYKIHYSHFRELKHVCSKCRKPFVDETHLRNHLKQVHSIRIKQGLHSCKICSAEYKNAWLLSSHEIKEHGKGDDGYTCEKCHKTFSRMQSLILHKRWHDKNNKKIPNQKKRNGDKTDLEPKEMDLMTCYSQQSSKFSCPLCVYSTERKNHFRRHLRGIHSILSAKEKTNIQIKASHKCTKCDKMFTRKDILYDHNRLRHAEINKPTPINQPSRSRPLMFECGICKVSIPIGQLTLHINRHKSSVIHFGKSKKVDMNDFFCEETRMFKCCFCSEKTPAHMKFVKHLKGAHKSTVVFDPQRDVRESFPFQCSKCDLRLPSKLHLRNHELRHGKVRKSRSKYGNQRKISER